MDAGAGFLGEDADGIELVGGCWPEWAAGMAQGEIAALAVRHGAFPDVPQIGGVGEEEAEE
jgi:hypothetical protein